MKRRNFLQNILATAALGAIMPGQVVAATSRRTKKNEIQDDRAYFVDLLYRMSYPVLSNMAQGKLKERMSVEVSPTWDGRSKDVTYLECFGRLLMGIAPWLALPDDDTEEGQKRKELRELALQSIRHAVDPLSPDYLLWRKEGQPLVDSAFFTNALIRAPKQLWEPLDAETKKRVVTEITQLRRVKAPYTNWLLFAAMNEAFLAMAGEKYDPMRVDLAVKKIEEWYVGDGWYSDGNRFHYDYYNAFVIHPMQVEVLEVMCKYARWDKKSYEQALMRMQRYAEHLERMVSPEGTFPPIGRSVTYRTASFQPLALLALRKQLPEKLTEGQVRAALTSVHKRIFTDPSNFNAEGFLTIGFAGKQPELGDWYSNNGSMYMTSVGLLALGLPADDSFWTAPAEDWTSKKAFVNDKFNKDYPVRY